MLYSSSVTSTGRVWRIGCGNGKNTCYRGLFPKDEGRRSWDVTNWLLTSNVPLHLILIRSREETTDLVVTGGDKGLEETPWFGIQVEVP